MIIKQQRDRREYECMKRARLCDTLCSLANISDQRYISCREGGHRYSQPGHWLLKAVGYMLSGNGCMKLAVHYVVFMLGTIVML
jgi:hypothetical protein